jgi:hypothetical protein
MPPDVAAEEGAMRRVTASLVGACLLIAVLAPGAVNAAPPAHESVSDAPPLSFGAGEICADPVTLSTVALTSRVTAFAPAKDGSSRFLDRGFAHSRLTNDATGATFDWTGGYGTSITTAADGSVHVAATGTHFAWYLEGDDSDLPPGMWAIRGLATEDYAADGTFLFATFRGHAVDACAAVGAD